MRDAFAAELTELAASDPRVTLLSGDVGNNLFNRFRERCPGRFFNCGAAEANMTGVAAGMARCGLRPVTYTLAAFNPGRCAEQVRIDLCLQNLPVVAAGAGAGLAYASLGPTHHALEDLAWMRALPNLTVVCPGDAVEVRMALRQALAADGPVYLRLGKKGEPRVHDPECPPPFRLGRMLPLREGRDACLLAVGTTLPLSLAAAEILSRRGVGCGVASFHTVKPLDTDFLADLFGRVRAVAVVEEHVPAGGAWSAVAEWLSDLPRPARLIRCGVGDAFFTEGGGSEWARRRLGLTPEAVADRMASALSGKKDAGA